MSTQKFTPSINEPKSTPESESTPPCILDPLDDRIVERVDVVPFEGETVLHRVQGYEIIFHDRDGVEICRRIEAVEDSAEQDVVDYLPYHGTRIGFTESLRPALATRPLLGCSPEISVPASGIAVGTAGGYLRDENNEHGIADSADRVRRTKLADVTPVGMVEVLRGAASPLPNA